MIEWAKVILALTFNFQIIRQTDTNLRAFFAKYIKFNFTVRFVTQMRPLNKKNCIAWIVFS